MYSIVKEDQLEEMSKGHVTSISGSGEDELSKSHVASISGFSKDELISQLELSEEEVRHLRYLVTYIFTGLTEIPFNLPTPTMNPTKWK